MRLAGNSKRRPDRHAKKACQSKAGAVRVPRDRPSQGTASRTKGRAPQVGPILSCRTCRMMRTAHTGVLRYCRARRSTRCSKRTLRLLTASPNICANRVCRRAQCTHDWRRNSRRLGNFMPVEPCLGGPAAKHRPGIREPGEVEGLGRLGRRAVPETRRPRTKDALTKSDTITSNRNTSHA